MSEEVSVASEYGTPPSSPGPETLKKPEFIEFRKSMEQSSNEFEVVRQGELKKHIINKDGKPHKKGLRKWNKSYVVLTDKMFMTYRNAKDFMDHKIPCELFDVKQAKIRWSDTERSTKPNVFEIYNDKTLILFVHEEFKEANQWVRDFKDIEKVHQENHTFNIKDHEHYEEEKKTIPDGLNNFFSMGRPTPEEMKKKGLIRNNPFFKECLKELEKRDKVAVPLLVTKIIPAIEKSEKGKGMNTVGIYRYTWRS